MMLVIFAGIALCSLVAGQLDVPSCLINGETFQACRSCPATCNNPGLLCTAQCIPGCACPTGQLINTENNTCVDPKQCPVPNNCSVVSCIRATCNTEAQRKCCSECTNPCANLTCRIGSKCRIHEPTGGAYCEQSCKDNGGCLANQTCSLEMLQCINPPCPTIVHCLPIDPCTNIKCSNGFRCRVFKPTGEAYCDPSCDINNGGCPVNEECSLQPVQCIRAPCLPVVQCSPNSLQICPPKCSHEFCSNPTNKHKPCSQPSVTIPSCPDSCSTTFCGACYYSNTTKLTPFVCNNLCNYPPTRRCLYKWSICLRVLSTWQRIHRGKPSNFRCFEYACPQRSLHPEASHVN